MSSWAKQLGRAGRNNNDNEGGPPSAGRPDRPSSALRTRGGAKGSQASGAGREAEHRAFLFDDAAPSGAGAGGGRSGGPSGAPLRPSSALRTRHKTTSRDAGGEKDAGRVRVAIRLRPKTPQERAEDGDAASVVEVVPEMSRVVLRKSQWEADAYNFDSVFAETSSQARVYETLARPVVEGVLEGFNGTVMAYGQTGTGKTHTMGNLGDLTTNGKGDTADRGVMLRAVDDIINLTTDDETANFKIAVQYMQVYMSAIKDLLDANNEVDVREDPKTNEISFPGATNAEVKTMNDFIDILHRGEENRIVANQKLNSASSRSHSVLAITVRRYPKEAKGGLASATARISKLLIVDLAGSERVTKSGSEGQLLEEAKAINLSLTVLGKCINTLAESGNGAHIPYRESKLTRMLRDSFGGSAKTSLIVCVGPLRKHLSESGSSLLFGQRALKVENALKLREEVDYQLLARQLQRQVDELAGEVERAHKTEAEAVARLKPAEAAARAAEAQLKEAGDRTSAAIAKLNAEKDNEIEHYRASAADLSSRNTQLESEVSMLERQLQEQKSKAGNIAGEKGEMEAENDRLRKRIESLEASVSSAKAEAARTADAMKAASMMLKEGEGAAALQVEVENLRSQLDVKAKALNESSLEVQRLSGELSISNGTVSKMQRELQTLKESGAVGSSPFPRGGDTGGDTGSPTSSSTSPMASGGGSDGSSQTKSKRGLFSMFKRNKSDKGGKGDSSGPPSPHAPRSPLVINAPPKTGNDAVTRLFDQVGLPTIFGLLSYDDPDVRLHAIKVVANLAAEERHQEEIVREGGLPALYKVIHSSTDEATRRIAAGAIANLAMNEGVQERLVSDGALKLVINLAEMTDDIQTKRMVAGGIANLCGNPAVQPRILSEGGLDCLMGFAEGEEPHPDVQSQVARGFANFAKCDAQSAKILVQNGCLPYIIAFSAMTSLTQVKRHADMAIAYISMHSEFHSEVMDEKRKQGMMA
ncbi:hypothetical protein PPROV_000823100 [Pycnococcus provasolii]|uniref:Kinesin-like protein n=1 Tax=Pycnococcus provasolii TaxID=41880 RepID=A0A830HPS7_9CHLO|nr:hypothetical protein PPROV_000823100 [Pycnococcus provasolii]